MEIAHENGLARHLGVKKTPKKISSHFYWPDVKRDVEQFCRICVICQKVEKPNQRIQPALLQPIPVVDESLKKKLIDRVGSLLRTRRGNQYLLTIMCVSTRFPEALPPISIHAKNIVRKMMDFLSCFGLSEIIQSDQGSNLTSGMLKKILQGFYVQQQFSSAHRAPTVTRKCGEISLLSKIL